MSGQSKWLKLSAVKNLLVIAALTVMPLTPLDAQSSAKDPIIHLHFAIDGKAVPCEAPRLSIRVGENAVKVERIQDGFRLPQEVRGLYDDPKSRTRNNIDIDIACGNYAFEFHNEYPVRLLPGTWELGILRPTTWMATEPIYFRGPELKRAAWISYIEWECDECEPVVVESRQHTDIPTDYLAQLTSEQAHATGERAVDIAYALAVYNVDRERNTEYLVSLLNICNAAGKKPGIEGVCEEDRLVRELAELYWRGNSAILPVLLNSALSRSEALDSIGEFYADFLEDGTDDVIPALAALSEETRAGVCKTAAATDLSFDQPKRQRVLDRMRRLQSPVADDCAKRIEEAGRHR